MKTILKLTGVLLSLTITSCVNAQFGKGISGNGEVISKIRNVSEYDKISVGGSFDVVLISGKEGELVIEIESNLLEYLVTEVEDDKLKIKWKKGVNIRNSKKVLVTVPFKDIDGVSLAGSGDIFSKDVILAETFKTSIAGSGDIKLAVKAQEVISKVSGSGDIELKGRTDLYTCSVTGSGDTKAYELKAIDVIAKITGSGTIKVDVSNNLKVRITGSGDLYYSGAPKQQDVKVTGSGDIHSYSK